MTLSLDIDAEPVAARPIDLTVIAPATFRGVDCAVLAERYVAYRRGSGFDQAQDDPDVIKTSSSEPSSANV